MRRTTLRLATCALAGTAAVLLTAPAASADPEKDPWPGLPGASCAPLHAPQLTLSHGRKLG